MVAFPPSLRGIYFNAISVKESAGGCPRELFLWAAWPAGQGLGPDPGPSPGPGPGVGQSNTELQFHFQPGAETLLVGGECGIIPSQPLWETRFSDQETRCLKQTKNSLQSEWKSMRDNFGEVINSPIWGEKEKSEDLFTPLKDNGCEGGRK